MDREQLGEWLSAYLDDELTAEETELIECLLREDEAARRRLDELSRLRKLISTLPRHRAPSSIAQDVRSQLERSELLGDINRSPEVPSGRGWSVVGRGAMVAMLAFVVVGAVWVMVDRYSSESGRPTSVAMAPSTPREDDDRDGERTLRSAREELGPRSLSDGKKRGRGGEKGPESRARGLDDEAAAVRGRPGPRGARPKEKPRLPTLLEGLDVERKLAHGVAPAWLRRHRFADESVHLEVKVRDKDQRDALSARLAARLSERRVVNLADHPPIDETASFYHPGQAGVNFEGVDERQTLIRASARQIESLVIELGVESGAAGLDDLPDDRVVLTVDSDRFEGVEAARLMLRRLGEPEPARGGTSYGTDDDISLAFPGRGKKDNGVTPDVGPFWGLIKVVGVDRSLFPGVPGRAVDETLREQGPHAEPAPPNALDAEAKRIGGEATAEADQDRTGVEKVPVMVAAKAGEKRSDRVEAARAAVGSTEEGEAVEASEDGEVGRGGQEDAGASNTEDEHLLPEPVSLVERRLRAIEKSRATSRAAGRSEVIDEPMPAEEAAERLVTVVVRLVVDEPTEASTGIPSGAKTKTTRTKKPGRTEREPNGPRQ